MLEVHQGIRGVVACMKVVKSDCPRNVDRRILLDCISSVDITKDLTNFRFQNAKSHYVH